MFADRRRDALSAASPTGSRDPRPGEAAVVWCLIQSCSQFLRRCCGWSRRKLIPAGDRQIVLTEQQGVDQKQQNQYSATYDGQHRELR
ncbi:MAG: hypothetical protein DMG88_23210 [Acidobacteria bacterium]|nr:MAG: hypothetical protein DMG88_23210 [Acidobacteriota bacterium]